jgi:hypothetical protein
MPLAAVRRVPRRIAVPTWAVAIVVVWLGGVGLANWLSRSVESPPPLCLFHRVTAVPCPTCGTTRMLLALGQGQLADAVLSNPFMFAVLVLGAIWLILRLGFGCQLSLDIGPVARRRAWIVVTILFLFNWAYLIWREFG